jgi:hypothetical protein
VYPGINKPVAVLDWMARTHVAEDFVLVIDADMVMRRPLLPQVGALRAAVVQPRVQRLAQAGWVTWLARHAPSAREGLLGKFDLLWRTWMQELGAAPGTAISGFFGYLVGEGGGRLRCRSICVALPAWLGSLGRLQLRERLRQAPPPRAIAVQG